MTDEQTNELGNLVECAESYYSAAEIPMPDRVHAQCLKSGMKEIHARLRALYVEVAGEDPWEE